MIFIPWFPPAGSDDPFAPFVLALLSMDGSGATIIDHGPLANTVAIFNDAGASVYTQDTTQPLFGLPTLHAQHTAATEERSARIQNLGHALNTAVDPICYEGFFRVASFSAATESPSISYFVPADGGGTPVGTALRQAKFAFTDQWDVQGAAAGLLSGLTANTWHFIAQQYWPNVADLTQSKVWTWLGQLGGGTAALVDTRTIDLTGAATYPGFLIRVTNVGPTGTTTNAYEAWWAQQRWTKALRYNGTPTIAVPTGPFSY